MFHLPDTYADETQVRVFILCGRYIMQLTISHENAITSSLCPPHSSQHQQKIHSSIHPQYTVPFSTSFLLSHLPHFSQHKTQTQQPRNASHVFLWPHTDPSHILSINPLFPFIFYSLPLSFKPRLIPHSLPTQRLLSYPCPALASVLNLM